MPKFQIELDDVTYEALAALAIEELRQIPQQAAWVLMQTLRERAEKRAMCLGHVGHGGLAMVEGNLVPLSAPVVKAP